MYQLIHQSYMAYEFNDHQVIANLESFDMAQCRQLVDHHIAMIVAKDRFGRDYVDDRYYVVKQEPGSFLTQAELTTLVWDFGWMPSPYKLNQDLIYSYCDEDTKTWMNLNQPLSLGEMIQHDYDMGVLQ